jgi:hypothetical protein
LSVLNFPRTQIPGRRASLSGRLCRTICHFFLGLSARGTGRHRGYPA